MKSLSVEVIVSSGDDARVEDLILNFANETNLDLNIMTDKIVSKIKEVAS